MCVSKPTLYLKYFHLQKYVFSWLLRSQNELQAKTTELTKCYFWTWQLIIFSLEYQHIYHTSDCNYYSHLSTNFSRNSPFSLVPIAHPQSSQVMSVGKAPEPALGQFQCKVGLNKKENFFILWPVLHLSDPMAACSSLQHSSWGWLSDELAASTAVLPILMEFLWICVSTKAPSHPTSNTPESKRGTAGTLGDLNPSESNWVGTSEGQ